MNKRILAMLLAIVMVVLAVPVFALASFAAEPTSDGKYVTKWADNLPQVDPETHVVTQSDAWQIGNKWGGINAFNLLDTHAAGEALKSGNLGEWDHGGMWYINAQGGNQSGRGGQLILGKIGNMSRVSIRYTAEYSGLAALYVDNLTAVNVWADTGDGSGAFAIMVNGEMIWPAGATYEDTTNWYVPAAGKLSSPKTKIGATVKLNKGDVVEFLVAPVADGPGPKVFEPVVSYAATYEKEITLTFRNPETSTVVKTITVSPDAEGKYWFADQMPEVPEGAFGWFAPTNDGVPTLAIAYDGFNFTENMTFTAVFPKASFGLGASTQSNDVYASYPLFALADYVDYTTSSSAKGYLRDYSSTPAQNAFSKYGYFNGWDGVWTVGSYVKGTEYEIFNQYAGSVMVTNGATWDKGGMYLLDNGASASQGGAGALIVGNPGSATANENASAATWTALYDGTVNFGIHALSYASSYADTHKFVLAKNGVIIWPKEAAGETVDSTNTANWFNSNKGAALRKLFTGETAGNPLAPIEVKAGDQIQIAFASRTAKDTVVTFGFYVEYTEWSGEMWSGVRTTVEGHASDSGSKLSEFVPTDAWTTGASFDNAVIFKGAWTPVGYLSVADTANTNLAKVLDSIINIKSSASSSAEAFYSYSGAEFGQAPAVRAKTNDNNKSYWGTAGSVSAGAGQVVGWRYTAPYNGSIAITFDTFNASLENAAAYQFAILVNGQVVWPASGEWKEFPAANNLVAIQAFASEMNDIKVEMGDRVELLMTGQGEDAYDNKLNMKPTITYNQTVSAPKFNSAQVSLNDKLAVKLNVSESLYPAGATNKGAFVNGQYVALGKNGQVVVSVAAKESADTLEIIPVYTWGGSVIEGKKITTSVADMLKQYIAGDYSESVKNLAAATLNYIAAAQLHFNYNADNLANEGLDYEVATPDFENKDYVYGVEGDAKENVITPWNATLILNDTVDLKVVFVRCKVEDFANKYEFVLIKEGTIVHRVTPVQCVGVEDEYKAIFEGIKPDAWDEVYTIAVVERGADTPIGETVNYSVLSYIVRAYAKNPLDIFVAMLALYEAANPVA